MRIVCGLLGLLYGVVMGAIIGPMAWMEEDGPVWMDRIVKAFVVATTLGSAGLITGSLAVLFKRHWGTRLLLFSSALLLIAIYGGTAMTLGRYVDGHTSVLIITPFLLGLMVVLRWSWLQWGQAGFESMPPNAKQARWQFSIRALLLTILIVALWLSWRGVNLRQAERERLVATRLGNAADRVGHVGGSITSVTLNASAGDEHMKLLAELPMLRFLRIEKSRITDKGFVALKDSRQLVVLDIEGTSISSAGLRCLVPLHVQCLMLQECRLRDIGPGLLLLNELQDQMTVLFRLDLSGRNIGNEDVVLLTTLHHLSALNLNDSNTDDSLLAHLGQMPRLRALELRSTQVTDVGLLQLSKLQELRRLDLSQTQITDVGLSHLSKMQELYRLDLSQTRISDASVDHLKQVSGLRYLNLSQTNVTEKGLKQLRAALPNARIEADPED
jgi:Leucine Rich Repeat (LRR) protein